MGTIGYPELIVIFLIVLLLFGGRKIPEIARGLGKGIREFKKARDDIRDAIETEAESPPPAPPGAPEASPGTNGEEVPPYAETQSPAADRNADSKSGPVGP
ncbi:MAG: twin-arginine translocase TatA/TatE family subunit [Kiritimatiellaeota bacterium]|nr:twin-arginine translocase TatA/TatE family subunit [Kiritimatiellota bacterium]